MYQHLIEHEEEGAFVAADPVMNRKSKARKAARNATGSES
jgi:hypothetical protein